MRASHIAPSSSDLGTGSLPRPPRLGALPAVPRHPVRALALVSWSSTGPGQGKGWHKLTACDEEAQEDWWGGIAMGS